MNLFTADLERISIADIENFLGLNLPIEQRIPEGLRIDYKLKEPQNFPETIAAFANTAGGLLFVGVESKRKKHNLPIALPGELFGGGDIKARIAGKIISQVTPRPEIYIGVAPIPSHDKAVVVVRVALGIWPPYQFSMQDAVRIPVRIQDTNRQATLRELEQLFEKREAFAQRSEERLKTILNTRPQLVHFIENIGDTGEKPEPATVFQNWIVRPRLPLRVRLDRTFGNAVQSAIKNHFRDAGYFYPPLVTGDTHGVRWQAKISNEQYGILRCARTLGFTSEGDLHYAEKINRHSSADESVSDLFLQSLQFLKFAADFYNSRDYFAGFTVLQRVDCSSEITFHANFPDANGNYHMTDANGNYHMTNAIAFNGQQYRKTKVGSKIAQEVDSLGAEESEQLVLDFMLAHLRELCRASIDYDALKAVIKSIPPDRAYFAYF